MSTTYPGNRRRLGALTAIPQEEYTDEEMLFLKAVDAYKTDERRPYPTWREVLFVVHALGYRRPGFDDAGNKLPRPLPTEID